MGIKIVTDSTANLDGKTLAEYDIKVVSLSVIFADTSFKEVEITNDEFYSLMARSSKVPTSSQPSPTDFYVVFKDIILSGDSAVGIFISSGLSGTYFSALTAKKMILEDYPQAQIELIDSRTTIMEMGYAVLAAAKSARDGENLEGVVKEANRVLQRARLYFVPKTLDYLKKGGRIGGASALLGTLLKVRPVLRVADGKVAVWDKVRTFEKALSTIMAQLEKDHKETGIAEVTVHHINNINESEHLALSIRDAYQINVRIGAISPVIGLHVGPGTLGIAYYLK